MATLTKYTELRNEYVEDGLVYIDGWETEDENEDGSVLATIRLDNQAVEFRSSEAEKNSMVHDFIAETIKTIRDGGYS